MNSSGRCAALILVALIAFPLTWSGSQGQHAITISRRTYHGWPESFVINNGKVEIIVVPTIGRVMQFQFVDEPGVFWENPATYGLKPDPQSPEWGNFGGDKSWPHLRMIGAR